MPRRDGSGISERRQLNSSVRDCHSIDPNCLRTLSAERLWVWLEFCQGKSICSQWKQDCLLLLALLAEVQQSANGASGTLDPQPQAERGREAHWLCQKDVLHSLSTVRPQREKTKESTEQAIT